MLFFDFLLSLSLVLCFIAILQRKIEHKRKNANGYFIFSPFAFCVADHLILKLCDLDIKFLKSCFFFVVASCSHTRGVSHHLDIYTHTVLWNEFETHKKLTINLFNIKKKLNEMKTFKNVYILCACRTDSSFDMLNLNVNGWYTSKNVSKISWQMNS